MNPFVKREETLGTLVNLHKINPNSLARIDENHKAARKEIDL